MKISFLSVKNFFSEDKKIFLLAKRLIQQMKSFLSVKKNNFTNDMKICFLPVIFFFSEDKKIVLLAKRLIQPMKTF